MSQKHRVLIVGAGSIGERHLRCFSESQRCVVAVCEPREARRQDIVQGYSVEADFRDVNDAMAFRPTAAVICTPANHHMRIAAELAKNGVHLLIEKPLSTDTDGVDELNSLVERNRLVASVAYVHRAHPALEWMKQQIDSGRFGKPLQLYAMGGGHFPTGRPDYQEIYYRQHKTGGGAIQDALTHLINAAEWLVGPIDRLSSDAGRLALEGIEVEDTVHVLARHGSMMSCFCLNQYQFPAELSITVVCENGTCRYEPERNRWRWMTDPGGDWSEQRIDPFTKDALYLRQANLFLDAIEHGTQPLCTLLEAEQSLRVNLSLLKCNGQLGPVTSREGVRS
jgi:predicted dehydrogenase